eukprot:jgi/Ulvmu1/11682/UM008_0092.1
MRTDWDSKRSATMLFSAAGLIPVPDLSSRSANNISGLATQPPRTSQDIRPGRHAAVVPLLINSGYAKSGSVWYRPGWLLAQVGRMGTLSRDSGCSIVAAS